MVSFTDTSIAFSHKLDKELRRSYFLFSMINNPFLSKLGANIVKIALKINFPIKGIIRKTVFQQFCGGESLEQCDTTIKKLKEYGVKSILDFAAEGSPEGTGHTTNTEEILKTVKKAAGNPCIPFCVFKPSGIASVQLLEKIQTGVRLTVEEKVAFENVRARLETIGSTCFQNDVQVFMDSEESYYQDPLDALALDLMKSFNMTRAIVFNTFQMYRKGMLENLQEACDWGRANDRIVGVKLVRGAYMEKERQRSHDKVYQDPILPNKQSVDDQYNAALLYCMENIDYLELCSASHNEKSNHLLVELMERYNIKRDDPRVYFAQLYGMGDHISFNLASAGYNVVKYIPYGPVRTVMPYLFRRAQENTSIAGQSSRELELIARELKRRKGS